MNSHTQKINSYMHLGALIGPLLIALVFFIMMIRQTAFSWQFPVVGMAGLILCYWWGWKGVAVSIAGLAAVALHALLGRADDWMWVVTLTLCMMSSYVVTALMTGELQYSWEMMLKEIDDQRQSNNSLHDNVLMVQNSFQQERQSFQSRLKEIEEQLEGREQKLRAADNMINLVRDELTALHAGREKLLQELFEARQKVVVAKETDEASLQKDRLLADYKELLTIRDGELSEVKGQFESLLLELRLSRQQNEADTAALGMIEASHKGSEERYLKGQAEQGRLQSIIHELNGHIEMLSMEKQLLESTLARLQSELEEISTQRQDTDSLVESHKVILNDLHAKLEHLEKESITEKERSFNLQAEYGKRELLLQHQLEEAMQKYVSASQQVHEWEKREAEYSGVQQQLGDLLAQREIEQSDNEHLRSQWEGLQKEFGELQAKVETAMQQEIELKSSHENLQNESEELRGRISLLQEALVRFEEQDRDLKSHNESLQNEREELKGKISRLHGDIARLEGIEKAYHEVSNDLTKKQALIGELEAEKATIIQQLEEQKLAASSEQSSVAASREQRRLEGLYNQLREQFAQKSATLESTRRELFLTQEKLLALNKEMQELHLMSHQELANYLGSVLSETDHELGHLEAECQSEIYQLEELITQLVARESTMAADRI